MDLGTWVLSSAIISNLAPSPDSNQVPSSKSKQWSQDIFIGYNVKKSLYGVPLTSHTLSLSTSCILHLSHRVFLSFPFLHSQCLLPFSNSTIYTHTHTHEHMHIYVYTHAHTLLNIPSCRKEGATLRLSQHFSLQNWHSCAWNAPYLFTEPIPSSSLPAPENPLPLEGLLTLIT